MLWRCLAGLRLALILLTAPAAIAAGPHVFHASNTGRAGDVVGLQGGNFGTAAEAWIDTVDAGETPVPEARLEERLSASDTYLAVRLPESLPLGLQALFVKNTATGQTSPPVWLNRAAAWQALDLAGTAIDPGRTFRLAGRNLDLPGATSTVKFVSSDGATSHAAGVTELGDPFHLQVSAPAGLVAGAAYDLVVSNGFGGSQGETVGPRLTARAAGPDVWGARVPWAAEFVFAGNVYDVTQDPRLSLHAAGDGIASDAAALQAAINIANAAGGGVVYLPAGSYNLKGVPLTMKSRVVLQGDGRDLSRIFDEIGYASNQAMFSGWIAHVGVVDLALECGTSGFRSTWKVGGSGPTLLLRSRFVNRRKEVLVYGTNRALLAECEVFHSPLTGKYVLDWNGLSDVLLRGNIIEWSDGRLFLNRMTRFQMENNDLIRSVRSDGTGDAFGGATVGGSKQLAMIGNRWTKKGAGPLPHNNDGETILNENIDVVTTGIVSAATATTVQDSSKNFITLQPVGYSLAIVRGPGMGQRRTIVSRTATVLTLDKPWDITPAPGSRYSIAKFDTAFLIKDNILVDAPRGIWLYGCSLTDAAIVGNTLTSADGIWLRADQRLSLNRFTMLENVLVEGNSVHNPDGRYPARIHLSQQHVNGSYLLGNAFYGVEVRGNIVQAHVPNTGWIDGASGEGFYAQLTPENVTVDNTTASPLGVIFQNNRAINTNHAYSLSTGSTQTVIWNAWTENVGNLIFDSSLLHKGGTHASLGTIVGTANLAPEPADDSFIIGDLGETYPLDVLANDSDPDLGPGPLEVVSFTPPDIGGVALDAGQLVYTPPDVPPASAATSFTYTVSDGARSATAVVHLAFPSPAVSPEILAAPLTQTVIKGSSATFTTQVAGTPEPSLQWYRNDLPLPGEEADTLVISSALPADEGDYHVVAVNPAGAVGSEKAALVVQVPFTSWAGEFDDPRVADPTLDLNGDGVVHLFDYLFGLDPLGMQNSAALPRHDLESAGAKTYLSLTYRRSQRATDISVDLQASPALAPAAWQTVEPDLEETEIDPITGDPWFTLKLDVTGEPVMFLRLRAVVTPPSQD